MFKHACLKNILLIATLLLSHGALAGIAFVPAPVRHSANADDNEEFPESHFGQGYAARQVDDMETPDEETGKTAGPTRGIASVGDNPNSGGNTEKALITSQAVATQEIPQSLVSRKGVQEVSVIASDLGYFPKTVFVTRDIPVRMFVTGASKNTLCIMMDSFQVRKQLKSQKIEEITFVPNVPGKYRFYCPVNGMEGNLVVRELGSSFAQEEAPATAPQPAAQTEQAPQGARVPALTGDWHSALDQ